MIYVHVAEERPRELPDHVSKAASTESDPDRRILAMLAARGSYMAAAASEQKEVRESA